MATIPVRTGLIVLSCLICNLPSWADSPFASGSSGSSGVGSPTINTAPAPDTPASGSASGAGSAGSSTASSVSASASAPGPLTGKVGAAAGLTGLKDLGFSCSHLERALMGLLYEVNRQDMVVVAEPDVVGTMVIPALPDPSGTMSMGTLPARPKYMDFFMNQINTLVPTVQNEAAAILQAEANDPSRSAPEWQELIKTCNAMTESLKALRTLTVGPTYKNQDVAARGWQLHDQANSLNKLRKKIYHLLKDEEKQQERKAKEEAKGDPKSK